MKPNTHKTTAVNPLTQDQLNRLASADSDQLGQVLLELEETHVRTLAWAVKVFRYHADVAAVKAAMQRKAFLEAEYRWHEAEIAKID